MKQPSIPTDNILDLFDMIVKSETFPDQPGSASNIKPGEKKYGTIKSATARRIWTSSCILGDTLNGMMLEHKKLHECPSGEPKKHDCKKFNNQKSALQNRIAILEALKWHAMNEEYPESFGHGAGLRDGWEFVQLANSDSDNFGDLMAEQDPTGPFKTLVSRITDIFRKEPNVDDPGKDHTPVNEGEEVICEIVDGRIKALFRLSEAILNEGRKVIPRDIPLSDEPDAPMMVEFKKWIRGRTIGSIEELSALLEEYYKYSNVVINLFWREVQDAYPATEVPERIELRSGWKIVETEPDHSSILDQITAGATVIRVSSGSSLAKMFGIR